MFASLKSDFYIIKSNIKFYIFAYIFIIFAAISQNSQFLYVFYPTFISILLTISLANQNNTSGFTSFLLSMPISRINIVLGRYFFTICFSISSLFISCFFMYLFKDSTFYNSFVTLIFYTCVTLLFLSIIIPITYAVKPNYLGIVFLFCSFIPAISIFIFKKSIKNIDFNYINQNLIKIYNSVPSLLFILLICLLIALFSIFISYQIFKRKEF